MANPAQTHSDDAYTAHSDDAYTRLHLGYFRLNNVIIYLQK